MMRSTALVLLLVLAAAPAVVAANAPDPTWIAGLYDGADGDEVLALVWDQTPAVAVAPVAVDPRRVACAEVVPLEASGLTPPSPTAASRAPPRS